MERKSEKRESAEVVNRFGGNCFEIRPGANLYTNSVVALDAKTGKLLWYRQFIPHDVHDSDLSQVSPLFETTINGNKHQVITVSGKDGLLRLLDRTTQQQFYEVPITTR